jgi:LysR family glycine cleavage system transcriptional activator
MRRIVFALRWLSDLLPRFRETYLGIDLHVRNAATVKSLDELGADVAIDWGIANWSGLAAEKLMTIAYTPVGSPDFIERYGPCNTTRDLARFPVLHQMDKTE